MEKKTQIMVVILIIVLIIGGVGFFVRNSKTIVGNKETIPLSELKNLPKTIDKVAIDTMVKAVIEGYNCADKAKLYDLFGDYAKTTVSVEDFRGSLSTCNVLSLLRGASYSSYNFLRSDNFGDWYTLNYVAKYENGNGGIDITIKSFQDKWEIVSIRFNVDIVSTYNGLMKVYLVVGTRIQNDLPIGPKIEIVSQDTPATVNIPASVPTTPATKPATAASIPITPEIKMTGILINKTLLTLDVGASETLIPTRYPANVTNKNLVWKSSNDNIATVSNMGDIIAISSGVVNITVTTVDGGFSRVCNVTVNKVVKPTTL